MTIRETVLSKIDWELARNWIVKQCCNSVSYETLEVNPDGTLDEREEPSSNSWHTGTYVLTHTYGVPCNCDWCAEWDRNEGGVQEEYSSKEEFIEMCIDNGCDGSIVDCIKERVEEIPYGFFDDEKEV